EVQVARRQADGFDLLGARARVQQGAVDCLGELFDPKGHGRLAESRGLDADWVPNGLELEKGRYVPRRLSVPVGDDALDVVRGKTLELLSLSLNSRQVERVHIHVRGEHRRELVLFPREDVDDAV